MIWNFLVDSAKILDPLWDIRLRDVLKSNSTWCCHLLWILKIYWLMWNTWIISVWIGNVKSLVVDFSIADDLKEEEITFSCLSMLIRLTELTTKGSEDYFKKLLLCKSFLHDIILNSKQISKLSFRSIDIEGKSSDSVRKLIRNANHVKKWSMVNVNVTDSGFFCLTKNIRTLELFLFVCFF